MISQRFREILFFWWRNLGPIFLVTAPFALLTEASQWLFGPSFMFPEEAGGALQFSGISLAIVLLSRPLAEGTLIAQLAAVRSGKAAGLPQCLAAAALVYPPLLATYAIIAVGVSLGWLAFFFPALWVYTRLCFAPFLVVLKRRNPINALRESFTMTEAQQWPLLLVLVLVFLAYLLMSSTLASLVTTAVNNTQAASLIIALPVSLMSAVVNVAVFRYWEMAQDSTTH